MNILFDINHPAHVHLFKNAIQILKTQGHHVEVTARDKDITITLLNRFRIPYTVLSKARRGLFGLGKELVERQWKLRPILKEHKIHVCVSATGACNVHICKMMGIPTLVFYDSEFATLQNRITVPFATKFITPDAFQQNWGKNHITYHGSHDLAYLHPKYFKADPEVLKLLNIDPNERFSIFRFVSWEAAHDRGEGGFDLELKRHMIKRASEYGKVFISSERPLDKEFEQYRFAVPPEWMHDALYYADLFVGDGGSMATEAAILGTPSVLVSTLEAGVFEELHEQYKMMFVYKPKLHSSIIDRISAILKDPKTKKEWQIKRDLYIKEKIDLTEYMINEIKQYG